MLANLLLESGLYLRAKREAETVLLKSPNNETARSILSRAKKMAGPQVDVPSRFNSNFRALVVARARRRAECFEEQAMERVIGIDLGTTNSCVAVMETNGPR